MIGNAIKFTYKGAIRINVTIIEGKIVTSVSDSGLGISKEDLAKLFQFFGKLAKSSDINRGGLGLGLTISKMIIQQLGGDIKVESIPKKGSNFTFRLPLKVPSSN